MVEESIKELIPKVFYDSPESNVKRQKLIECVLARNSKLYLGKSIRKNKLTNLVLKKWISSLVIKKRSSQAKWRNL